MPDLLVVNPGGSAAIYQDLEIEHTAIEPPLWCRLIAGYVRDRGHSVGILDAAAEGLDAQEVARRVRKIAPKLICISVYGHQPSASTQTMPAALDIARLLAHRRHLDPAVDRVAPIIMVGGHVAALPERSLRESEADYVCNSEGPVTVERLLAQIKHPDPLIKGVPGLVWTEGRSVFQNVAPPLVDIDALHGDVWDLLPMEKYRAHNWQCFEGGSRQPYASIYTSLGCPYKCAFCCINAPFRTNRYRMRDPAAVVAEVEKLHDEYGVTTFKIVDEMFVLNDRHVRAICEGLAELPYVDELNFWAYARVDTISADVAGLLRKAGIRWICLGIESGSDMVRDGSNKSFDDSAIIDVVRMIQAAGINVLGNFIFGLPDDDAESMGRTLRLAKLLNCEFANFYSAMAYPGSDLYRMAKDKNLPKSWGAFSQHSFNCTPLATETMTSAEVLRFRDDAFHDYFQAPDYLDLVAEKFGPEATASVTEMAAYRLERELLL